MSNVRCATWQRKRTQHKTRPPDEGVATLDALAHELGTPDKEFRTAVFALAPDSELLALGVRVDSAKILADAPAFVVGVREAVAAVDEEAVLRGYAPALLPLLVFEARELEKLAASREAVGTTHSISRGEQTASLKTTMEAGLRARDATCDALHNAFGLDRPKLDTLDEAVGVADTPAHLATGLESLARLIRKHSKGDEHVAALLKAFGVTTNQAAELETLAHAVRTADAHSHATQSAPKVTQRALDLQDGRVLHLIGMILRSLKTARARSAQVVVPTLPRIGWMFRTRSGSRKKPVDTSSTGASPGSAAAADGASATSNTGSGATG